jgi:hypothetical protein
MVAEIVTVRGFECRGVALDWVHTCKYLEKTTPSLYKSSVL